MVTMVKDAAQVLARLREPDQLAEWNAFPDAGAERAADVQTGHRLRKPDGMLFGELHQSGEIECGPLFVRERAANRRWVVGIRDDFELPGLARQTDLAFFFVGQRVRQRLAT